MAEDVVATRGEVTLALEAHARGEEKAFDGVFATVYEELRGLARSRLKGGRQATLDSSDLVNEAYLRLAGADAKPVNRAHFFALSARVMRQIIVDRARRRQRQKRGGPGSDATLEEHHAILTADIEEVLSVDEALGRLAVLDENLLRTVECRYFAGYTEEETAAALGVTTRSVSRYWTKARNWLEQELSPGR
jgi:RNA polymerase sigma factor (TIGR02999 family)